MTQNDFFLSHPEVDAVANKPGQNAMTGIISAYTGNRSTLKMKLQTIPPHAHMFLAPTPTPTNLESPNPTYYSLDSASLIFSLATVSYL